MNRNFAIGAIIALLVVAICIAVFAWPSTSTSNQTTTANATSNATQNATSNATQNVTVNTTIMAPVSVQQGQNFTLRLQSNPSTGYHWQPTYDTSTLNLKSDTVESSGSQIGGSGT